METLPNRSPSTKPDPLVAALSVICPLICGRMITPPELAYIRTRISRQPADVLLEAIEWLGDHADRVSNPIAAILDRCAVIRRDRDLRETAKACEYDVLAAKALKAALRPRVPE